MFVESTVEAHRFRIASPSEKCLRLLVDSAMTLDASQTGPARSLGASQGGWPRALESTTPHGGASYH